MSGQSQQILDDMHDEATAPRHWYIVTDADWEWDQDEGQGLTVVLATSPSAAAAQANAIWDKTDKADGADIKVGRIDLVGWTGFERQANGRVQWGDFRPAPSDR